MKVLLNVAREVIVDEWAACEGVKLIEREDGSFDLILTKNLEEARSSDRRLDELLERAKAAGKP
jgi:hypothetical protein